MLLRERIPKPYLLMFLANPELKLLPVANVKHGLSVEPETGILSDNKDGNSLQTDRKFWHFKNKYLWHPHQQCEQCHDLGFTERYLSKTSSNSFFLFARLATISLTCAIIVPNRTAAQIKRKMQYIWKSSCNQNRFWLLELLKGFSFK